MPPIHVKESEWGETADHVFVTVPIKTSKSTDIFTTAVEVKINAPPYLFQCDLFDAIDEEESTASVQPEKVVFRLVKKDSGVTWGKLRSELPQDQRLKRRAEGLDDSQQKHEERLQARLKQKREEENAAFERQWELEKARRQEIEKLKQQEKEEALRELAESSTQQSDDSYEIIDMDDVDDDTVPGADSVRIPNDRELPPPRVLKQPVTVTFKAREDALPARQERDEAREQRFRKLRTKPATATSTVGEGNPMFLKDKGDAFFRKGDVESAINAYTAALEIDPQFIPARSNRAAAYLKTEHFQLCVNDCAYGLQLLGFESTHTNEDDESTVQLCSGCHSADEQHSIAVKLYVRRGTAYAALKHAEAAVDDYEKAVAMDPENGGIAADLERLRIDHCIPERSNDDDTRVAVEQDEAGSSEQPPGTGEEKAIAPEAEALKTEGDTLLKRGNIPAAIDKYTEALAFGSGYHAARGNRSAAYLKAQKHGECLADCELLIGWYLAEKAGELSDDVAVVPIMLYMRSLVRKGACEAYFGNLDSAYDAYNAAMHLDPFNMSVRDDFNRIRQRVEAHTEAMQYLNRGDSLLGEAKPLEASKAFEAALQREQSALQTSAQTSSTMTERLHLRMSVCFCRLNRIDDAVRALRSYGDVTKDGSLPTTAPQLAEILKWAVEHSDEDGDNAVLLEAVAGAMQSP